MAIDPEKRDFQTTLADSDAKWIPCTRMYHFQLVNPHERHFYQRNQLDLLHSGTPT